ncbi:MAG: preprotein translocase subunit SecD [Microgenomates group bacterium ADurb.Bin219]|nr:MAG: preprotein translocase subunit SecD [Microgenomates group bacterium ADurb.Bin219]
MKRKNNLFWLVIFLTGLAIFIDLPEEFKLKGRVGSREINWQLKKPEFKFKIGSKEFKKDLKIVQGLDLQGGTHLVFEAQMQSVPETEKATALEAAKVNIERRINYFGVSEPLIQTAKVGDSHRIVVEIAGVKDINQAIDLVGKTAQLEFWEENPDQEAASKSGELFLKTDLTGKDLTRSSVQFDQQTGQPVVSLEFSAEGGNKFEKITERNIGKIVAIFLDGMPVSTPRVEEKITGGSAVIRGEFDVNEAKKLSIQLNAGALPVPIKIIEQKNIGATLGEESIRKSITAGLVGILLVILFMWLVYGRLGILANLALIIYGLWTLALYKIIPITLSLPGIAGFLLSIGMAVDSNILVFERMKEETRSGKPLPVAMELGFGRAWDSIRDANITTLITAFILYNPFNWGFLNNSGMVRGFSLTLVLGTALSLFTGIVVTRTLIRVFYRG